MIYIDLPDAVRVLSTLSVLTFLVSSLSHAQSQTFNFEEGVSNYSGFKDTTIFSESENSGGGTSGFFSGTINNLDFEGNKQHRRALLSADLSMIPSHWTIENVALTLRVQTSGDNFGNIDYSLHAVSSEWGEGDISGPSAGGFGAPAETGDATWLSNQHSISTWTTEGSDYTALASATAIAGTAGNDVTWSSAGMISDVQQWLNSPASNHGWCIIGALEGTRKRVKKFYSSESNNYRPRLVVTAHAPLSLASEAYIDFSAGTPSGNGEEIDPVDTIEKGLTLIQAEGSLLLSPGSTDETLTIYQAVTLYRNGSGGSVTIGDQAEESFQNSGFRTRRSTASRP